MNSYKERKDKELQFLKKYLKETDFVDKADLVTKIKQDEILKKNIPISNMSDEKFYFGKNVLDYTYLRFKHDYTIYNEEKLIGVKFNDKWHRTVLYFNSGMSAITALIESILSIKKVYIKYSDQIYFETYKLLQSIKNKKSKYFFAFYDAIDPEFNIENISKQINDKKCLGIILDTTCLTETKIEGMIQECIKQNKLVFLVKSFTKLDMLATEYSRIGCLTMFTSHQLTKSMMQIYKNLYVNIKQKNINYNCCPSPFEFPSFWDDDEFFNLNNVRIKKIKENNCIVFEHLKQSQNFVILKPNHQLFLLIYPKNNYDRNQLVHVCKEIASKLNKKFDIKYCGSFGFDFIALDTYVNISDNKETIRLSLNDYDDDMVKAFSKEFLEVIDDCL